MRALFCCTRTYEYSVGIQKKQEINKELMKCTEEAYERDQKMKEAIKTLLDTGNKAIML